MEILSGAMVRGRGDHAAGVPGKELSEGKIARQLHMKGQSAARLGARKTAKNVQEITMDVAGDSSIISELGLGAGK